MAILCTMKAEMIATRICEAIILPAGERSILAALRLPSTNHEESVAKTRSAGPTE